jgi:hypothetical protein
MDPPELIMIPAGKLGVKLFLAARRAGMVMVNLYVHSLILIY